jgi:hypothetical protein
VTVPARSLAWSVSTAVFKGLLLSRSILVQNSRCGVFVKEARKEWHPPKEVLNSANIEGRDRRGLVQLPNSIGLHGARGLKVQILKGIKEHQVQSSFVGITVVAPLDSVQGTHSTLDVELRTYNPHAVWVRNGRCNVEISITIANVVWIGGYLQHSPGRDTRSKNDIH